ncbi:MAG: hypothetical protein MJE77_18975 [Proteobacteria bacterium]|nr:hypothetical protein [Pseudomonadota bacterium]
MSVPLPQSCIVLALLLPGIWLAGRELSRRLSDQRAIVLALAPGLGAAMWLLAIHAVALITGSFVLGLWIGTCAVAGPGCASWWYGRRQLPGADRAVAGVSRPSRWMWPGAVVATAWIAPAALGWAFHDEVILAGHMSFVAQLQNDIYPPRYGVFPDLELRYHYGFDILCAAITALTRLSIPLAIDLLTLASWAYSFCLLWLLGARWLVHPDRPPAPAAAALLPLVVLFGAGIPFFADSALSAHPWLGLGAVGNVPLNPPLVSYHFQHPWTAGLPLALCLVLIIENSDRMVGRSNNRPTEPAGPEPGWGLGHHAAVATLLVALALSQVVLFASLFGAVLLARVVAAPTRATVAQLVVFALAVAGLAVLSRGFFAPASAESSTGLTLATGIAETLSDTLWWHVQSMGFMLPLGIAGLAMWRGPRVLLATLAVGGLLAVNLLRYTYSWDIVKFATVAGIALSMASAVTIARLARLGRRWVGASLAALALVPTVAAGVLFPLTFTLDRPGIPPSVFALAPDALSAEDAAAVAWLRGRADPGVLVYRRRDVAGAYAQWGGIAQPWIDPMVERFPFARQRLAERRALLRELPADIAAYREAGFGWVVLDDRDRRIRTLAEMWQSQGQARMAARFGHVQIIELSPGRDPP